MSNVLKYGKQTRSWAVGISLLLHGLLLVGMGVGSLPGSAPQPDTLAVYLAMPSAVEQKALVTNATVAETAAVEAVTPQPTLEVNPDLVKVEPAPETLTEPLEEQRVQATEIPAGEISKTDTALLATSHESRATHPDSEPETSDISSNSSSEFNEFSPDHRLPITDHQSTLLAYAGDPSALGMLARDVLGPDLVQAEALSLPEPVYPALSRRRGEEGRVIIEIEISAKGKVLRAQVTKTSSFSRLDRAALEAVKMAVFSPAIEFGVPVESERIVAYRFIIKNE
jgi:TonB family protein